MIVVAGVDDSPVSRLVVARAAEQAKWRSAELHLVHVTYVPVFYVDVPVDITRIADAERSAVWSSLEESLAGLDVAWQRIDLDGYPPDMLMAYVDDVKAGLLVVGTRGRGDFASLILGSTSHRAIHTARCDVLVVKAEADGRSQ
jgi:nucleotide-binding universal stress UspA family protein